MPDTTSGLWNAGDVYRRIALGTWVSATPGFSVSFSPAPAATPFTTGSYEGYVITASTTMTVDGSADIEYLVIAGGGGGGRGTPTNGYHSWAGGGAGGYLNSVPGETNGGGGSAATPVVVTAGPYAITVGAGGAFRTNGSPSSIALPSPISSTGGGTGGYSAPPGPATIQPYATGSPGGSGGGGSISRLGPGPGSSPFIYTPAPGGTGSQGYPGGAQSAEVAPWNNVVAGGGGGAGSAGSTNGNGGNGLASSITGTSVLRGGGGAGGSYFVRGTAGPGGGGTAYLGPSTYATSGTANTGGGGGGSYYEGLPGIPATNGGSGVVIIRWLA